MRMKLTAKAIAGVKANGTDFNIQDTDLKGFHLRVTKNGAKSFRYRYRKPDGSEACVTIAAAGVLTPDEARTQAAKIAGDVALGNDPAKVRDDERKASCVREIWEQYEAVILPKKKAKTQAHYRIVWTKNVQPHVGSIKMKDLSIADVEKMVTAVTAQGEQTRPEGQASDDRATWTPEERKTWRKRGGKVAANHARSLLSALCSFARQRSIIIQNPCEAVEKNKQTARDIRFADEELMLIAASVAQETDPAVRLAFRFFMETAARHNNVCELEWSELVGLESAAPLWRIPAEKMKGGKAYEAHLSPELAKDILKYQEGARVVSKRWLFPRTTRKLEGKGAAANAKREVNYDLPRASFDSAWTRIQKRALAMAGVTADYLTGLQDGTIHTFKHTYLSRVADLGASASDIQTIGAHSDIKTSMGYVHRAREGIKDLAGKASSQVNSIVREANERAAGTNVVSLKPPKVQ